MHCKQRTLRKIMEEKERNKLIKNRKIHYNRWIIIAITYIILDLHFTLAGKRQSNIYRFVLNAVIFIETYIHTYVILLLCMQHVCNMTYTYLHFYCFHI